MVIECSLTIWKRVPLGGGSVGLITKQITEPLLVTNGDVLTHFSPDMLLQFHKENSACATIGARYVQTPSNTGNNCQRLATAQI